MEETTKQKKLTAKNAGWSAYQIQIEWARQEAQRLTLMEGRLVTASEVIQRMVDEKRKREAKGKK